MRRQRCRDYRPGVDRNEQDFHGVVKYASALCMSLAAGFVGSIKQLNPTARFELDATAAICGVLGGAAVLLGWRFIFGREGDMVPDAKGRGWRFGIVALVFLLVTAAAFMHALRDLSPEKRHDVTMGSLAGLAAIGLIGVVVWRIISFLEADFQQGIEEEEARRADTSD